MNFQEYEAFFAEHRKNYHFNVNDELALYALGLAGETGEVTEIIKKWIRDGNLDRDNLKKELGDVLAYIALLCYYFNFDLEEIAVLNVEKNEDRAYWNKLHGSGNDR